MEVFLLSAAIYLETKANFSERVAICILSGMKNGALKNLVDTCMVREIRIVLPHAPRETEGVNSQWGAWYVGGIQACNFSSYREVSYSNESR